MKMYFRIVCILTFFILPLSGITQTKLVKKEFVVLDNTLSISNESVNDETCYFGGGDGSIQIAVSGGSGNYTIQWFDNGTEIIGATSESLENLTAGDYSVTVTDIEAACTKTEFFTVNYYCPYSCSGSLTLTSADPSSCTSTDGMVNASLLGGGPYNYTLSKYNPYQGTYTSVETGTDPAGSFSRDFDNLIQGEYELYVFDVTSSCNYYQTVTLTNPEFYFLSFSPTNNTDCVTPNGKFSFTVNDPTLPHNFTVNWKNTYTSLEGSNTASTTNISINDLKYGYYVIELEDLDNPGCVIYNAGFISNQTYLSITPDAIAPQTSCNSPDGAVSITVNGGSGSYQYFWSGTGGKTTEDIFGLMAGSYSVSVFDAISGCYGDPANDEFTVSDNAPEPVLNITASDNTSCSGPTNGSFNLTTSVTNGPYTYEWRDTEFQLVSTVEDPTGLAPGEYSIVVTNVPTGCSTSIFTGYPTAPKIADASTPAIAITTNSVTPSTECISPGNGAIDVTVDTAVEYETSWTGPSTFTASDTEILSDLGPGTYTLTVTVNCSSNQPPVISPPDNLTISNQNTSIELDLLSFISDPDDNLNPTTLTIVEQPESGADASIVQDGTVLLLQLDYSGITFQGTDQLRIRACDDLTLCTENNISIDVNVVAVEPSDIEIFNAISADGNSMNDFFDIKNIQQVSPDNIVTIYNRWGDKVFEISGYNNESKRFEGKNDNGKELPAGTYYYKIELTGKTLTGYLSLKR